MSSNHVAKKRFGQNFLTDKNLLQKIVKMAEINNANVLEIGPGKGALTTYLVNDAKKYLGIEVDFTLKSFLISQYASSKANFIFGDFLKQDIAKLLKDAFDNEPVKLVANLPYYITTPIIFEFLKYSQLIEATIMVQKEVGERLISATNEKSYNALSAILQYYCQVIKVMDVNRKLFTPVPKVDSMVIKLTKIPSRTVNEQFYGIFVKGIFKQKRKLAINNLVIAFDLPKAKVSDFFIKMGLNPMVRAEELTVVELIKLSDSFKEYFAL